MKYSIHTAARRTATIRVLGQPTKVPATLLRKLKRRARKQGVTLERAADLAVQREIASQSLHLE